MPMNPFFFKINLNKYGEEKKVIEAEKRTLRNTIIFFTLFYIILFGMVFYLQKDLQQKYDNRKHFLNEIEDEISSMKSSGDFLSNEDLNQIATITSNRIFWGKKLVALSELIPREIAITSFSYKRGILTLSGITKIDKNEREMEVIYDFIGSLKENDQISKDFPEINFEKHYRDREKEVDILRFQIDCVSKESKELAAKGKKS
jgi:hypothetical protein